MGPLMLCQFSFENFKSYRDEATLDLQAAPIKEFSDSLIRSSVGKRGFLPIAVIYGPNGGGKSGVLEALRACINIVLRPISFLSDMGEGGGSSLANGLSIAQVNPFKFDGHSAGNPTRFELYFQVGGYEYQYILVVSRREVVKESLFRKSLKGGPIASIFEREGQEMDFGTSLPTMPAKIRPNARTPLLSYLYAAYEIPAVIDAVEWLQSVEFLPHSGGFWSGYRQPQWLDVLDASRTSVLSVLKGLDLGISDLEIEEISSSNDDGDRPNRKRLSILHEVDDALYQLRDFEESQGTRRILQLLPWVIRSLETGSVLVVDELDEKLHPKMLREVISLYRSKVSNEGGGQLIFTSHDVWTMRSSVFRRDEIWFAAKDDHDSSSLYSLYEIKDTDGGPIKTTAAYDKQYMEGRYGADPYFERILDWDESVE